MTVLAIPQIPLERSFGFECELSGGAREVVAHLYDLGVCSTDSLHEYHCGCYDCEVDGVDWLFHAQEDCTCDGEIITSILEYGSERANLAFSSLGEALLRQRAIVDTNAGNHVHVDQQDLDDASRVRLIKLFYKHQDTLAKIAKGKFSAVRGYNAALYTHPHRASDFWAAKTWQQLIRTYTGTWLHWHGETFEFRLWNATRVEWRLRTHVGISVAMVQAAADGVETDPEDYRSLEEVLSPYLDPRLILGLDRQKKLW